MIIIIVLVIVVVIDINIDGPDHVSRRQFTDLLENSEYRPKCIQISYHSRLTNSLSLKKGKTIKKTLLIKL